MDGLREDEYRHSVGISELHLAQMLNDPGLIEKIKAAQMAKQISRLRQGLRVGWRVKNKDGIYETFERTLEADSKL